MITLGITSGAGGLIPRFNVVAFSAARLVVVHLAVTGGLGVPRAYFAHESSFSADIVDESKKEYEGGVENGSEFPRCAFRDYAETIKSIGLSVLAASFGFCARSAVLPTAHSALRLFSRRPARRPPLVPI
jgi:hypothetical protein